MEWIHNVSYFWGGAFFINAVPHMVSGLMGRPFQSPFARPPGKGLSSSTVNVLWGSLNLAIAYLLILRVGIFDARSTAHIISLGAGSFTLALFTAINFGRLNGGNLEPVKIGS